MNQAHTDLQRYNMVEQQVRTWDVLDHRVLDVLHQVERELFVRPEHAGMAYADVELPVPGATAGQKLFKPVFDGRLLQSIELIGDEHVLEIGTGSGYTTACLARLARQVVSVEIDPVLANQAQNTLKAMSVFNAKVLSADALKGFDPAAKFDVIVLGAAVENIPAQLLGWMKPDGRLFAVRGLSPVMEAVMIAPNGTVKKSLFETDLPYLIGAAPQRKFVF
jgi:protein-L-isoaspartate(D-aspartate) O-methyltransferase